MQGLRRQFPVLSKEDMRCYVGGYGGSSFGDGYGSDWLNHGFGSYDSDGNFHWYSGYTQDDFENWEGPWYGGWIYGMGYVFPDVNIYGYQGGDGTNYYGSGYYGSDFNISSTVNHLTAHAENSSTGYCARYVRLALEAGDIVVHEATDGHPHGYIAMYNGSQWISDFV